MTSTPFVFLHGLTFDHHSWDAAVAALPPGSPVLAPDLPGHGAAPSLAGHRLEDVVEHVHELVLGARLGGPPIVVGHSIGALLATIYAARHPVAGLVSVEHPLRPPAPFVRNVRALEMALRGPGWADLWAGFRAGMHLELLPPEARELLRAGDDARQDMLLSYWADVFELEPERLEEMLDDVLEAVRRSGVPVAVVYGYPLGDDRAWVQERLPGAELIVWPVGHHLPHLAYPERFGGLLRLMAARAPVPIPVAV